MFYTFADYRNFQEIETAIKRIAAGAETLEKLCTSRLLRLLLENAINNGFENNKVVNIKIEEIANK